MMKYLKTILLGCVFAGSLNAQVVNTLYFMDKIPQSLQLNPAIQPKCDFYWGLVGVQTIFGNSSISMNDVLYYDKSVDSLIFFARDKNSRNKFINNLKDVNNIYFNAQIDPPVNFGFRIKDLYFNFGASIKSFSNISYSKDFMRFLVTTNLDSTASYNFKDMGFSFTNYAETYLGASKAISDVLTVGVRGKLLSGIFNLSTDNKRFDFFTTVDSSLFRNNISSDLRVRASTAYLDIKRDSAGNVNGFGTKDNFYKYYKPFQSLGFGIDLGATYAGIDKLTLSASLIDLGFIKWKNDEREFTFIGDTSFMGVKGIKINQLGDSTLGNLLDSFQNAFKFSDRSTTYTTWLPTKIYLAAEYAPASFFSVGVLSLTQIYRKQLYQQFMFSGNLRFFRASMFSMSYSVFENGFSNFGLGFSTRTSMPLIYIPPLQLFFIADNIPFRFAKKYYFPYKMRNFNMRFGVNIVFGCGQQKKKMKDRPLIFE